MWRKLSAGIKSLSGIYLVRDETKYVRHAGLFLKAIALAKLIAVPTGGGWHKMMVQQRRGRYSSSFRNPNGYTRNGDRYVSHPNFSSRRLYYGKQRYALESFNGKLERTRVDVEPHNSKRYTKRYTLSYGQLTYSHREEDLTSRYLQYHYTKPTTSSYKRQINSTFSLLYLFPQPKAPKPNSNTPTGTTNISKHPKLPTTLRHLQTPTMAKNKVVSSASPCNQPLRTNPATPNPVPLPHPNQNLPVHPGAPTVPAAPWHQSAWRFYMDQNPWTFAAPIDASPNSPDTNPNPQSPLPLPPNPTHPRWINRCYNCLEEGHDQNDCLAKDRVCARCWNSGHQAQECRHSLVAKRQRFDLLLPRGNLGEEGLPPNRPESAIIFILETQHINNTNRELARAIILDARLLTHHDHDTVQTLLMRACNTPIPLPLTHLADTRYLLLLPLGTDRERFLHDHTRNLQTLGLIPYPWSLANDSSTLGLRFKAWIELKNLSPNQWNLDHLIPAVSTFGVVLEHSSMQNVRSMQKMMVVLALPDLAKIPKQLLFWERGMLRGIEVKVHSWLEDPINFPPIIDTAPPQSLFELVRAKNLEMAVGIGSKEEGETITFDFDTLFAIWKSMPEGKAKTDIEANLRRSPRYLQKEMNHSREFYNRDADPAQYRSSASHMSILDPPVLSPTGVDEGRLILQSINCDKASSLHAHGTDGPKDNTPAFIEPANSATGQVGSDGGRNLSELGEFVLHGLGPEKEKRPSWADMVEEEELIQPQYKDSLAQEGSTAELIQRPGKEIVEGPTPTNIVAGPSKTKGKRPRLKAKKQISEADLRRSVRISKNPGKKLYTPKKDPRVVEPNQTAQVAKKVAEAGIIQALSDEVIMITPLLEEQINKVNIFCARLLEEAEQVPAEGDGAETADPPSEGRQVSPTGAVSADPTADIVPIEYEPLFLSRPVQPVEETLEEESEEEPEEEGMLENEEIEANMDHVGGQLEGEDMDSRESVLDGVDFSFDEDDSEELGGDASG